MKFRNSLKRDIDRLSPSPSLLSEIDCKIQSGQKSSAHFSFTKASLIASIAIIACLTIVFSAFIIYNSRQSSSWNIDYKNSSSLYSPAKSYDEVLSAIQKMNRSRTQTNSGTIFDRWFGLSGNKSDEMAAPPMDAENDPSSSEGSGSLDYSETNNQVSGVDEADIVKTDGKYIYSISSKGVTILSADGADSKEIATIELYSFANKTYRIAEAQGSCQLFVAESRLALLISDSITRHTLCAVYDISDIENPKNINTLMQDGRFVSARMIGNNVYIISKSHSSYYTGEKPGGAETNVPIYSDGNGDSVKISYDDIYLCNNYDGYTRSVVTVASVCLTNDSIQYSDIKSILGYVDSVYCSENHLYLFSSGQINKFFLKEGKIEYLTSVKCNGSLLNQFSLDEYKGFLRIVTTMNGNNVYVYDENLNLVSQIEGLAKDERVYSVRFIKDTGYFVTFRQVDPLFSVDLSDPYDIKMIGALKIPGFSNYLQPYSDTLLFGIGHDADEVTGAAKTLKLSMFDIADPSNVKEIHRFIFKNCYYSEAGYNHKAILLSAEKNLILFPSDAGFMYFSYSEQEGFIQNQAIAISSDYNRVLYNHGNLYFLSPDSMTVWSLSGQEILQEVWFKTGDSDFIELGDSIFYNGPDRRILQIPEEIGGKPVKVIYNLLFYKEYQNIEKLVLPKNLEIIYGLIGCENICEIVLQEGIREIGSYAFAETGITSIVLPFTLTEVACDAFPEGTQLYIYEERLAELEFLGKNYSIIPIVSAPEYPQEEQSVP